MKILKGGILGGAIVFVWSAISWMALPWHEIGFERFTDEELVAKTLKETSPIEGIYLIPFVDHFSDTDLMKKAAEEKMRTGPTGFMMIHPHGVRMNMAKPMVISFLFQVMAALLVTYLLLKAKLETMLGRITFVVSIATVAGILGHAPNWIWWGYPTFYTVVQIADLIIAWLLAGIALSRFLRYD